MTHLILHKVRGEPAFDIGSKFPCPVCEGARQGLDHGQDYAGNCGSCDDGYWWIVPTSGHRAYPYQVWNLEDLQDTSDINQFGNHIAPIQYMNAVPADWPDHYEPEGEAPKPDFNIMSIIAPLLPKIRRRV
jgi:hypothetical protein